MSGGASAPLLHSLTEVNEQTRVAVCSVCGFTKVRRRSDNGKWRCVTSEKASKYGLDPGEFNELVTQQHGRCAICNRLMSSPHVDHDHATGTVRGLLCSNCNTGIGLLGDSPDRLLSAILYRNPDWEDNV